MIVQYITFGVLNPEYKTLIVTELSSLFRKSIKINSVHFVKKQR